MTIKEWEIYDYLVSGMLIRNKTWRAGQGMFNALELLRPDLANEIRATPLDPFHNNDRIGAFYAWLKEKLRGP